MASTIAEPMRHRTIEELAAQCLVSSRTIARHVAAGEIDVVKIGRATRITQEAFDAYIAKNTKSNNNY